MTARELKDLFVNFFKSKDHVEIPSASLVPENDSTTLFISAGMHPLVPFLLGQPHPLGKRLVNIQKCVRTGDIDEVGDNCHHTFFEMLGNWSLGDYFKETMIPWSYEFITKHLNYKHDQIHVTCFAGDSDAPKDEESAKLWQDQGISRDCIHFLPKSDNWWGPAGDIGPCGPDSEMFIDTHPEFGPIDFTVGCKQGRIVEIGNDVFMQYNKTTDGKYVLLTQKNVDTGWGVERNVAIINGLDDDYLTDIWQPVIKKIEQLSGKKYSDNLQSMRIIADHIRSAVFIIADGVQPGNKEAGYVLRRLIRRAIRQGKLVGIETNFVSVIGQAVLDNQNNYAGTYPELDQNKQKILDVLETEEIRFRKTLDQGLQKIHQLLSKNKNITGEEAFDLYQSYGFPLELTIEETNKFRSENKNTLNINVSETEYSSDNLVKAFITANEKHQQQSRTLSAGKFKSGLADSSEVITKYHTATHLLHTALRQVLGKHVQQSGSNITSERLRFDFSHGDKLSSGQIEEITTIVQNQIDLKLAVTKETMLFTDAQKQGALAFFGTKYPDSVSVYTIGNFSKEVCTGPHVDNTQVLGTFKIIKEESAGSGKRRIYAVLE